MMKWLLKRMPMILDLSSSSNNTMTLSLKVLFISTAIFSLAILLKLSSPSITDLASVSLPSLYDGVVSWLKPPYLYLLMNFIVITILASSKLQSIFDHFSSPSSTSTSPPPPLHHESYVQVQPLFKTADTLPPPPPPPQLEVFTFADYFPGPAKVEKMEDFGLFGQVVDATVSESPTEFSVNARAEEEVETKHSTNDFVISKSTWATRVSNQTTAAAAVVGKEYSVGSAEKPPAAARFGHHRKTAKAGAEGGKTVLKKVSKPKKQDTLETTWKTITEGRAMPLTRHLRKSDTWEMQGRHSNLDKEVAPQKMTKSETFTERSDTVAPPLSRTAGSGKLKKEASLGQDELNRRVEAFIKKFNEEMRLQRQESLNQYMEMINRGAH